MAYNNRTPSQLIPRLSASVSARRSNRKQMYAAASNLQQQNQIEVQGEAYLCFSEDYATFQGNINTSDESNYSIVGESVSQITVINPLLSIIQARDLNSIESTPNESEDDEYEYNTANFPHRRSSSSASSSCGDNQEVPICFYNVALTDHYTGLTHRLQNVVINKKMSSSCQTTNSLTSTNDTNKSATTPGDQILFRVENLYKGQKADMMLQQYIGSPSLLGKKSIVYSGNIDILFNEAIDWGKSWSL